jgi:hypothetical protein
MDTPLLERRMLLRGAGIAGASLVGVAAAAAPASAHDHHDGHDDDHDLLGSWLITHSDTPPSETDPGTSVVGFAPGGLLVTQDVAPVNAAGVGTWESRGDGRYKATFWTGFPADGAQPAGLIKISVRGEVDGDETSGTYRGKVYEAKTRALLDTFEGTFSGERIDA